MELRGGKKEGGSFMTKYCRVGHTLYLPYGSDLTHFLCLFLCQRLSSTSHHWHIYSTCRFNTGLHDGEGNNNFSDTELLTCRLRTSAILYMSFFSVNSSLVWRIRWELVGVVTTNQMIVHVDLLRLWFQLSKCEQSVVRINLTSSSQLWYMGTLLGRRAKFLLLML